MIATSQRKRNTTITVLDARIAITEREEGRCLNVAMPNYPWWLWILMPIIYLVMCFIVFILPFLVPLLFAAAILTVWF